MPQSTVYKGDYGVEKDFTITNTDGTVKDISGLTPTLKVWQADPAAPLLTVGLTIITAAAGLVKWVIGATDLNPLSAGFTYTAEIQLTAANYRETTQPFGMMVKAAA